MKLYHRRWVRISLGVIAAFSAFVTLNNASWLVTPTGRQPTLLAHRGLAQTFHRENLTAETCTAARIYPPEHAYLENTIASMRAAFAAGADIVEFDVHPTTDGHFIVFHDWTLDCRTDGTGVTRDHTLAELKARDIGFGYTADGGKTFPFRGKGVGLMPTLDEVLTEFPTQALLINIKSNDPNEGAALAQRLSQLPPERIQSLMAYGGDEPMKALRLALRALRVMSRKSVVDCGTNYIAYGWSGFMPKACERTIMLVPKNIAPWLWGWPDRLLERFAAVNTTVFVTGDLDSDFTSGVDNAEDLGDLPAGWSGGIWTNRIDRIGPLVKEPKSASTN